MGTNALSFVDSLTDHPEKKIDINKESELDTIIRELTLR